MTYYDRIIIGSGVAGLSAAFAAEGFGRTLLLTKSALEEGSTRYAQGGIAVALGENDSAAAHLRDTLAAGAGLVDEQAASVLTASAAERIDEMVRIGVPFDRDGDRLALGREAAHSAFRIVHAGGDATGRHLEQTLAAQVRTSSIEVRERVLVTRILVEAGTVAGVETLDCLTGERGRIETSTVILATGGAGQLYRYTTNPPPATGDGIALAYRAGAEVMDLEFIQFHPTALRLPGAPTFLISEAVRGEGAILRDEGGHAFMADYDARAELAPRDVVARAIHARMAATGADHVYLDLSHLPAEHVRQRFPQIDAFCRGYGLDITRDRLPVAPAAHYTMGGVRTSIWGETNIPGLFAAGEVACTGVHGANRLASNSLLEGLVFGARAGVAMRHAAKSAAGATGVGTTNVGNGAKSAGGATAAEIQELMWREVGLFRDRDGLTRALKTLEESWTLLDAQRDSHEPLDADGWRRASILTVARLITRAALRREESRGGHYRSDFPQRDDINWKRRIAETRAKCNDAGAGLRD
jgi:L-aspartate oxidase